MNIWAFLWAIFMAALWTATVAATGQEIAKGRWGGYIILSTAGILLSALLLYLLVVSRDAGAWRGVAEILYRANP